MEFTANRYRGEEQIVKTLAGKQKYTEDVSSDTFRQKAEQRLFTQRVMLWSNQTPLRHQHRMAVASPRRAGAPEGRLRAPGPLAPGRRLPGQRAVSIAQHLHQGPGALPRRDTGLVKLRITPVNGDTVYMEIGGTATPASQRLSGRDYETWSWSCRFLPRTRPTAMPPDRVHLEEPHHAQAPRLSGGRRQDAGASAAPEAPMRYSTDGSNPMIAGATYESPFVIPAGTRFVLACAERNVSSRKLTSSRSIGPMTRQRSRSTETNPRAGGRSGGSRSRPREWRMDSWRG